ncbi:hypothetical protein F7R21_08785 [Burkholderia latens]|uniref:Uncharacterized protein n=1 Tax=Burkholderia latens TaxID=488446 RepID=A0A6H9SUB7_9BURK|nr:hypothetical protein F7R21_08785 [Burkholderia latens]
MCGAESHIGGPRDAHGRGGIGGNADVCAMGGGAGMRASERSSCRRSAPAPRSRSGGHSHDDPRADPHTDLRGNRLYTLLPGRTGRASALSLYSRRIRHPSRNSSANTLPMQESS